MHVKRAGRAPDASGRTGFECKCSFLLPVSTSDLVWESDRRSSCPKGEQHSARNTCTATTQPTLVQNTEFLPLLLIIISGNNRSWGGVRFYPGNFEMIAGQEPDGKPNIYVSHMCTCGMHMCLVIVTFLHTLHCSTSSFARQCSPLPSNWRITLNP